MSWVLDKGSSGVTVATGEVGSTTGSFDNFIRSAPTVRKFSDSTGGGIIAGDLDTGGDKIADGEGDNKARCICTFMVDSSTFFSEKVDPSTCSANWVVEEERRRKAWTLEAWLEVGVGVGLRLRSKGKQKGHLTGGTLRTISVHLGRQTSEVYLNQSFS